MRITIDSAVNGYVVTREAHRGMSACSWIANDVENARDRVWYILCEEERRQRQQRMMSVSEDIDIEALEKDLELARRIASIEVPGSLPGGVRVGDKVTVTDSRPMYKGTPSELDDAIASGKITIPVSSPDVTVRIPPEPNAVDLNAVAGEIVEPHAWPREIVEDEEDTCQE